MNEPADLPIDELLDGLGVVRASDRSLVLEAMIEERLTNGRKTRIAARKEPVVRELIERRFVRLCEHPGCLRLALADRPELRPIRVAPPDCAICGGGSRAAVDILAAAGKRIGRSEADLGELAARVGALLAGRPAALGDVVRRLRTEGIAAEKRDLRRLAGLLSGVFGLRPGEIMELRIEPERLSELPILLLAAERAAAAERLTGPEPEPLATLEADPELGSVDELVAVSDAEAAEDHPGEPVEPAEALDAFLSRIEGPLLDPEPATPAPASPEDEALARVRAELREAEERRLGSFLAATGSIEADLRRRAGSEGTGGESLFGVLATAAARDPLVSAHRRELGRLVRLRNAVVHEASGHRPAVIPSEAILEDAWRLARALADQGRARSVLPRAVEVLGAEEPLERAVSALRASGGRPVPVREAGRVSGAVGPELLLDWLDEDLSSSKRRPLLHGPVRTVGDLLARWPDAPSPIVVGAGIGPSEAAALLVMPESPGLLLITPSGDPAEEIVAVAGLVDLPALLRAAEPA